MSSRAPAKAFTVVVALAVSALVALLVYLVGENREQRWDAMDAAIESQVLTAYQQSLTAAEALHLEALFRDVLDTHQAPLVANGRLFSNDAMRTQTRENFRGLRALKYTVRDKHVTLLSPHSALLVASGTCDSRAADGREFSSPFAHTIVYLRQAGEWRVLHSHQSTPAR